MSVLPSLFPMLLEHKNRECFRTAFQFSAFQLVTRVHSTTMPGDNQGWRGQSMQTHDAIFKQFLSDIEVARDFLSIHLPSDIRERCDFSTLQLESASFIDEKLRTRVSDMLYSLHTRTGTGYLYCCHHACINQHNDSSTCLNNVNGCYERPVFQSDSAGFPRDRPVPLCASLD